MAFDLIRFAFSLIALTEVSARLDCFLLPFDDRRNDGMAECGEIYL